MLKEKFGFAELFNLLLVIIGVAFIIQPPFLMEAIGFSVETKESKDPGYFLAAGLLVGGNVIMAIVYVAMRKLKGEDKDVE